MNLPYISSFTVNHKVSSVTYQECHLSCEDNFVLFKQASAGVHIHWVGYAVNEIQDSLFYLLGTLGTINGFLKHNTESLD